ncbi:transposase [Streptomyces sp. NPDC085927]|uniref:transposase n=1 Tax=Streptomyces sp. NPDC085927 TaxID=3365738 RepID=UPI0037D810C8
MLDGRRKSIQPMAERLPDGDMQDLQQFVNQPPWHPLPVRQRIAERLRKAVRLGCGWSMMSRFPSAVPRRPGGRQCCGALGKRANCQVAATGTASCPLEWELLLPVEWAHDDLRRRRAGVPDEVGHGSKTRLDRGCWTDWPRRV